MRILRLLGIACFLGGVIVLLFSGGELTGAFLSKSSLHSTVVSFFAVILIFAGTLLFALEFELSREKRKDLEERIRLFPYIHRGKEKFFFLEPLAASDQEYHNLVARLETMERHNLLGTSNETPLGRVLSQEDIHVLKDIFDRYLPAELRGKGVEVYLAGSLAPRRGGKTSKTVKQFSDQFYLSDSDIFIIGPEAMNYIRKTIPEAVRVDGRLRQVATRRFTLENYLTDREKKDAYLKRMPGWVCNVLEDLSHYSFAGEKDRPVNMMFFENRAAGSIGVGEELLYHETMP